MDETVKPKRLILVGPMGSGKTTIARAIAERTGLDFIDTDELIVRSAGKSIPEIFDDGGEPAFRALESAAVEEAAKSDASIIACGGGTLADDANARLLRSAGRIVYLEIEPETGISRIGDLSQRPLLQGPDPVEALRKLIDERRASYLEHADMIVDASKPLDELVDELAELLA